MKSVLELAKKGPSVYSIKHVMEIEKKKEERSFKSVWTNLQATKRYYAPKTPPPPTMIVAWILRILVRNFCMMCKIRGKLRGNESEKRAVGTARNREYAVKTIRNDSNMHKKS